MKVAIPALNLDQTQLRAIANVDARREIARREDVVRWAQSVIDAALAEAEERYRMLELHKRHERESRLRGAAAVGLFLGASERSGGW